MVALPVVPHIGYGGQYLLLGYRPAGQRSDMVPENKRGIPQSGETQRHRFRLAVGEELVSSAGADDERGPETLAAQLRKGAGGICNQLRRTGGAGD